jgi:hypothetical protein
MKHFTACCLASCVFAISAPFYAHAETLDDASIRQLYAETTAHLRNPAQSIGDERERLAENYLGKITTTTFVNGQTISTEDKVFNKATSIASTIEGYKHLQIEEITNDIKTIQFSKDKTIAYVSNTTSSTGTMTIPISENQSTLTPFDIGQGCVDQLNLINSKIQISRSECLLNIYLKKPR